MNITFSGQTKAARQLQMAAVSGPTALAGGLYQEAETVMTASKQQFVPVDLGALRDSGFVQPPVVTGTQAHVVMGFGGPSVDYAVIQHEDLTLRHTVGGPKYLELPLRARLQGMPAVLKMHVQNGVRQAIQRLQKVELNLRAGRSVAWGMPLFRSS